jgi:hypothetical protein
MPRNALTQKKKILIYKKQPTVTCCYFLVDDEAFGYLKRVIVTPAVYPRLVEFLHFDIQSTGQKSHCVNIGYDHRNALF